MLDLRSLRDLHESWRERDVHQGFVRKDSNHCVQYHLLSSHAYMIKIKQPQAPFLVVDILLTTCNMRWHGNAIYTSQSTSIGMASKKSSNWSQIRNTFSVAKQVVVKSVAIQLDNTFRSKVRVLYHAVWHYFL